MTKLKPCPFCGGKATIIRQKVPQEVNWEFVPNAPEEVYTVGCDTWDCILHHEKGLANLGFITTKKDVLIKRWNRRAEVKVG